MADMGIDVFITSKMKCYETWEVETAMDMYSSINGLTSAIASTKG